MCEDCAARCGKDEEWYQPCRAGGMRSVDAVALESLVQTSLLGIEPRDVQLQVSRPTITRADLEAARLEAVLESVAASTRTL